ncbi:hypothetical protein HP499_06895 [Paenarthrobacter sp. CM16]|jgi:hypothetical protein|uniref:hypothetical protein n=1 Tax=Paenarthrobacter sp. CM16 TaxID=2738447 RepID=UPI00155267D6|nr:hypothetical protein [Paenarthrobacter sp. CM16]NQD87530.1 hypothetical protein [Paenarthrobacter sp. CM16]
MNRIASKLSASIFLILVSITWITVPLRRQSRAEDRERGDVPGWVMITLMSAVLVAGLLAMATPALEGLFDQAIEKVGQ